MVAKYADTVTTQFGTPIEGATIQAVDATGANAELYSDIGLTNPIGTSVTTNQGGYAEFYVPDGTYTVVQSYNGISERLQNIALYDTSLIARFLYASITFSEAVALGAPVNLYASAGQIYARNANAASGLPAHGFSTGAYTAENAGNVIGAGLVPVATALSGTVYLDDASPGSYTSTAPTTAGHLVQQLGIAIPGLGILFNPQPAVSL